MLLVKLDMWAKENVLDKELEGRNLRIGEVDNAVRATGGSARLITQRPDGPYEMHRPLQRLLEIGIFIAFLRLGGSCEAEERQAKRRVDIVEC